MLFQYRLLTRAAPIQSHDRKGVVSATNAQHHAVEDLVGVLVVGVVLHRAKTLRAYRPVAAECRAAGITKIIGVFQPTQNPQMFSVLFDLVDTP